MTEEDGRKALVIEAVSWVGTPYISNGLVKGKRGGTDCAMLLLGIFQNVGLISKDFDPRPYAPQWHVHQTEERYLETILRFAKEFAGPPKAGDVVLFKLGKVHAHGGIVTDWPHIIHAIGNDKVCRCDVSKNTTGKRALANVPTRYFTYWPEA